MRFVTINDAARARLAGFIAVWLTTVLAWAEDHESATEILRRADEARGSMEGVVWSVDVHSVSGRREESLSFSVSNRAYDFLAVYTAPPRQRDARLLMVNRNMWFFRPGLSRAVPISQRQRLLGQAAYGDLASTNYAEEYTPERLPDETLDDRLCFVFDLRAKPDMRTTYDHIIYWIEQETGLGVKARFFTVSGKEIKIARMQYDHVIEDEDGNEQPFISKMTIQDALLSDAVTTIRFGVPDQRPLPDSTFDLNLFTQ